MIIFYTIAVCVSIVAAHLLVGFVKMIHREIKKNSDHGKC